jgi:hypothetical protein
MRAAAAGERALAAQAKAAPPASSSAATRGGPALGLHARPTRAAARRAAGRRRQRRGVGAGEYVKRDDVPSARVDVVRIGRLSGAATTALVEYLASVPRRTTARREAQKLVDEGLKCVARKWLAVACLATAVGCATSPYNAPAARTPASALSAHAEATPGECPGPSAGPLAWRE